MSASQDTLDLGEALRRYALDHGAAAANVLIIESATDGDLAKVAKGLTELKKVGPGMAAQVVRAVGKLMEERDHHRR